MSQSHKERQRESELQKRQTERVGATKRDRWREPKPQRETDRESQSHIERQTERVIATKRERQTDRESQSHKEKERQTSRKSQKAIESEREKRDGEKGSQF